MLELSNIRINRGNKNVLNKISAGATSGSITLLLGENGCGKTSLLGGISGLLKMESGEIRFNGKSVDPESEDWRENLSYILDDGGTIPLLSVSEQLQLQCLLNGTKKIEARDRVEAVIRLLNLEKYKSYRADELSAGLRKKLGIGLGIIRNAGIYLFDEPFSSLDALTAAQLLDVLSAIKAKGKAVILSTHSPSFVSSISDSVWMLKNGGITETGKENIGSSPISETAAVDLPWIEE